MYLKLQDAAKITSALKAAGEPDMASWFEGACKDAWRQHGDKATISVGISAAGGYATGKSVRPQS